MPICPGGKGRTCKDEKRRTNTAKEGTKPAHLKTALSSSRPHQGHSFSFLSPSHCVSFSRESCQREFKPNMRYVND